MIQNGREATRVSTQLSWLGFRSGRMEQICFLPPSCECQGVTLPTSSHASWAMRSLLLLHELLCHLLSSG